MNRQVNPVRRYISAALTLLTLGLSVAVPVMERGSLVGRMAIESEHDPATASRQVTAVLPDTGAQRAGLRPGDRIVAINGRGLGTPEPFCLRQRAVGIDFV